MLNKYNTDTKKSKCDRRENLAKSHCGSVPAEKMSHVKHNFFYITVVEQVVEHKHLGIWLTPSLCWSQQIHEICMIAMSKLAVLRSFHYLSWSTLDLLFKS